ncbi:MAG TPA: metal ABC transporter permease [Actinomycetota bacterium]|nr:metal ABC transporter permease [Actinomycetota bacterium]
MIADIAPPFPFELAFMQRALIACLAVGAFAPTIGVFLVQKRLSLIGDGIGHVAFAGVGAGFLAGWAPLWTALAFAVAGALAIEWFQARRNTSGDVALAILAYSGIALGVVLISLGDGGVSAKVLTYLFGQPLTVRAGEVRSVVALGLAIVVTVTVLRRAMFSVVTDQEWSRVAGLPVATLNSLLAVLTAVAVVAAMQIVGILLVAAMMVLPVASAQLLARSFRGALGLSVTIGAGASVAGLALSRIMGLATGGAIVLVATAVFVVVAVASGGLSAARSPQGRDG